MEEDFNELKWHIVVFDLEFHYVFLVGGTL
jgi:hypothetical protein